MAKTARLDQILLQLGYVHIDEIARALRRQQVHGGRLGMNLVQLGAITEDQLVVALAEQFRMPTLKPTETDVPAELVPRMPQDVLADGLVVPLAWNEAQKVLSVATANPGDLDVLHRVKEAFGARGMRVGIAPEGLLAALGKRIAPRRPELARDGGKVALPELFADRPDDEVGSKAESKPVEAAERVVMVTAMSSRKDFLPSVFEREGVELVVVSDRPDLQRALETPASRILVSDELFEAFAEWRREGLPSGSADVIRFPSVSGALTGNPLAYTDIVRTLKSALQALADYRSGELGVSPPYGLIAADAEALAAEVGLRGVARDGLDLCVHLLLPQTHGGANRGLGSDEPFAAFASSLELATRLRFPWPLDAVLATCHRLYRGGKAPSTNDLDGEADLAARILALVWYRHNHVATPAGSDEERMVALRTAIRSEGARFAPAEIVEGYLNLITRKGALDDDGSDRQILLVGADRIERALTPALARVGRETVLSSDLPDAQAVTQRRAPAAVIVDYEVFGDGVDRFARITKLGGETLLFVLTDSTNPSLVLNLLDVGADDVFGPPHDFDLVAARVNRAIRSRARSPRGGGDESGQFSANFEVFSFLDLIQMLSQGMKTVRVDLSRGKDKAVVYMRKGRIIHATLGDIDGERAVYAILEWEDNGAFTVRQETEFPEPSIQAPTESVLMEGLRLLDESRR